MAKLEERQNITLHGYESQANLKICSSIKCLIKRNKHNFRTTAQHMHYIERRKSAVILDQTRLKRQKIRRNE